MRICKRKGIRTLVYHRVTHAHLPQIFSQPAQLQATWRRRDGPSLICVCTILTPQPTKALVLPVFYLNELQRHASNCQSGARDGPLAVLRRRTRHACALQSISTGQCFFPPLQPITQGAGAKAPRWKMAGKLEPLKMEPLEVEEAEEDEGNEGLSQPGQ